MSTNYALDSTNFSYSGQYISAWGNWFTVPLIIHQIIFGYLLCSIYYKALTFCQITLLKRIHWWTDLSLCQRTKVSLLLSSEPSKVCQFTTAIIVILYQPSKNIKSGHYCMHTGIMLLLFNCLCLLLWIWHIICLHQVKSNQMSNAHRYKNETKSLTHRNNNNKKDLYSTSSTMSTVRFSNYIYWCTYKSISWNNKKHKHIKRPPKKKKNTQLQISTKGKYIINYKM